MAGARSWRQGAEAITVASADSSLVTDGCRLAYGTAEFKSTDVVLTRADGLFSAHEDFALWKVLISSPGKRSPVLGLVRQSHRRVTKISRCRNNSALNIDRPASLGISDEPTGIESGHSNGGISNSVRTHFRLCWHHSRLAGMALLPVILLLNRRDRRLSYAPRPRPSQAPDAIRTGR